MTEPRIACTWLRQGFPDNTTSEPFLSVTIETADGFVRQDAAISGSNESPPLQAARALEIAARRLIAALARAEHKP